jgi:hypothetical protein
MRSIANSHNHLQQALWQIDLVHARHRGKTGRNGSQIVGAGKQEGDATLHQGIGHRQRRAVDELVVQDRAIDCLGLNQREGRRRIRYRSDHRRTAASSSTTRMQRPSSGPVMSAYLPKTWRARPLGPAASLRSFPAASLPPPSLLAARASRRARWLRQHPSIERGGPSAFQALCCGLAVDAGEKSIFVETAMRTGERHGRVLSWSPRAPLSQAGSASERL